MQTKNINYTLLLLLFSFFQLNVCLAQETKNETLQLNLKKAIEMALNSSESYKIRSNTVKYKEAEYRKERSDKLPQINGSLTWSNNFYYPSIASTASTRDYQLDSGVTVEQKIFTFGKVSSAVKAAKKDIEASRYDKESFKQKVIYDTKLAYYSAYLAKETLEIAKQSYNNAKENKKILRSRTISGRASRYDNIKISADISSRKPVVDNAYTDYDSAMETLRVVVGIDPGIKIGLVEKTLDNYPDFKRDELALSLYHNQPAIKALAKLIEKNQSLISSKKGNFYPELSLFGSWNHKGSSNDFEVGERYLEDYGVAGLKVNLPIWTGGKTAAELAQARIDKENAELEYKKDKEDYLLELDKALSRYKGFLKTLDSNKEAVYLAEEAFEVSQEMFKAGKISIVDLNDSELKLTNEKINKEITLFNINITLAKIERLALVGD
ncbi:MAG: TolC family protein [Candidatus Omnitrophica bacterium]|nr:TolC family protein [Candidatus Omnitrophota bacterium]